MNATLIKALVAARKEIGAAKKGSVNPHFKSKYADLAAVMDAVREPLSNHGLEFVQDIADGHVFTVLIHDSGETLRLAPFPIVATKQDAQGHGSALTYARRYSLQTALGVPAEDDDGNAASKVVISPVKSALQGVQVDQGRAESIAKALIDFHAASESGDDVSYAVFELVEPMDSDMKLAVWDILSDKSKVRSWIKKIMDAQRKAA